MTSPSRIRGPFLFHKFFVPMLVGGIAIVVGIGLCDLDGFGASVSSWLFGGRRGTVWASGYSERAFRKIKPGMPEAEVYAQLGRPLEERMLGEEHRLIYATWLHEQRNWMGRGEYPGQESPNLKRASHVRWVAVEDGRVTETYHRFYSGW